MPARKRRRSRQQGKKRSRLKWSKKPTARDLFEYIKEAGSRGYDKTRYKGLGEMNSEQLWQTTMDPERRTLLSVKLEDLAECETIFSTLMGEDVEARRKVHRRQRAGREEPRYLVSSCGAGALARQFQVHGSDKQVGVFDCAESSRSELSAPLRMTPPL
jgi:hypothetical protein